MWPSRVSTCANASPLRSSRCVGVTAVSRRDAATAAASPARAASPSSIVLSRFSATSTLSAMPAAASNTAITPVKTSVSFSRRGILRITGISLSALWRSADPAPGVVGPFQRLKVGLGKLQRVAVDLREVALLVAQRGGQDAAFATLVAQQRGRHVLAERQLVQDLVQRRVEQRVGGAEQPDGEQAVAILVAGVAAEQLAHAGSQQGERDELVGHVGNR